MDARPYGFFNIRSAPTLSRVAAIRFFAALIPLIVALGFTLAFHDQYGKHKLSLAYFPVFDYGATLALCVAMLGLYALLVRALERRWPQELALKAGASWAGGGALMGCALFSAVYLVFSMLGVASWGGVEGVGAVRAGRWRRLSFRLMLD